MHRFPSSEITKTKTSNSLNKWLAPTVIVTAAVGVAFFIHWKHESELQAEKLSYTKTQHLANLEATRGAEAKFALFYQGLRTISRLPGVQSIDRYAKSFDSNAKGAVQEIYNNLGTDLSVSEVYIVPRSLDADKIDPVTHQLQAPITTFDKLIINKNAAPVVEEKSTVPEVEIFEYRLMKKQLEWMAKHTPTQESISGLNVPAISGPEVITCDNSKFNPQKPEDKDRSGLVLSVPFLPRPANSRDASLA